MNAIDLEVIYQSTLQIARELTLNMLRTGYSTIIKESQDFTFAIFDAQGRMVAQGIPQPLHIGPLAAQVNEIRRRFRRHDRAGRRLHRQSSLSGRARTTRPTSPSSRRCSSTSRIVGYIGNIAHKPDLGGKVPGTNSGDATDLFQEGLLIPPLKILRRGELNADVEEMICANTRTPEVTWGDISAQINTNTYGLTQFAELFAKYGIDKVLACWQRWMDICETELRKEIAKVPDGLYGPETDYLDDDGVDLAKAAPHLGLARGQGRHAALHPRQRRAGARPDQPAALRVAQLHRMPGEDDLHPAAAGERRPVAAGAGVLSAGRLAAQSALSGAGEHVCAAEPGHDLGRDARPGARRARPRAGAGQRRRRLDLAAPGAIRNRAAGIRNTRSSTAAPARGPTATASAPWTSWSST